jgi:CheY-like chemotaxis protein
MTTLAGAKILVVDDDPLIVTLLRKSLSVAGHAVVVADSGEAALALAAQVRPDLVLMDKNMPGVGGVETMQRLKAASGAAWTPVIMLSGDASQHSQIEALKLGCDDYLTKPVDLYVLNGKIAATLRVLELHRTVSRQNSELQAYRDRAEEEAGVARFLLSRLMGEDQLNDPDVAHWIQPSSTFSGDLLAHARAPSGELYVMLADATGHGLPAAMTLVPMIRIFHSMAVRGFHLRTIALELNRLVHEYTPVDRFVAMTLACLSPRESMLSVVNAGNPGGLLYSAQGQMLRCFKSHSIALGIVDSSEFDPVVEIADYPADGLLVLYSDGLPEACNAAGQYFGVEQVHASLAACKGHAPLFAIRAAFDAHMQGQLAHDDVSLLVVHCPAWQVSVPQAQDGLQDDSRWRLEFALGFAQLKTLDVVPTIVGAARALGLSQTACARLHTVLSELYANALEHGLLLLDSSLKEADNGFELFMNERQRRMQALSGGEIVVNLMSAGREGLKLRVRDSGEGFLYRAENSACEPGLSGRGLALVYSLCRSVQYFGCGNEVEVELRAD